MTDKTLKERLREWKGSTMTVAIAAQEAADALDAQEARIKALEGALRSAMGTMQATISRLNYMGKPAFELMDAMNNARALLGEE